MDTTSTPPRHALDTLDTLTLHRGERALSTLKMTLVSRETTPRAPALSRYQSLSLAVGGHSVNVRLFMQSPISQIETNDRTASSMWGLGVLTCTTAPGLRAASPQSNPMSNPMSNPHSREFGCGFAGSQSNSATATSPRVASLLRATATQLVSMPKGSKPRSSSWRASASSGAAPSAPSVRPLPASTARPPPPRACRCRMARTRLRVRRPRQRA